MQASTRSRTTLTYIGLSAANLRISAFGRCMPTVVVQSASSTYCLPPDDNPKRRLSIDIKGFGNFLVFDVAMKIRERYPFYECISEFPTFFAEIKQIVERKDDMEAAYEERKNATSFCFWFYLKSPINIREKI